jgi:hypothetical protein
MCRNLRDFLKIPILVSFFVFFIPYASFALVDTAQVSCDPQTSIISTPGGMEKKFSVNLVVDGNADSLTQCEIYLSCDKTIIAIDSVSMGSIWEGTGGFVFKDVEINPTDSDQVYILYSLMGAEIFLEGPGVLATVRFRTRGYGQSDLVFDSLVLRGSVGPDSILPSKGIKGKVIVQSGTGIDNSTDGENVIFGYSLGQNYPNPFNPNTCIDFDLPRSCQVKLEIYNILGSKVKTLVNEKLNSGHQFVTWDGKDDQGKEVASGVYFYRLSATSAGKTEEFSLTKRMLLLR